MQGVYFPIEVRKGDGGFMVMTSKMSPIVVLPSLEALLEWLREYYTPIADELPLVP